MKLRSLVAPCLFTLAALAALAACVGTTGGEVVDFPAAAAGPADARAGEPLAFTTDRGWHVVLTKATLHVGAIYLDQTKPVSGAQNTSCILPGTYVAQVTIGLDVDLLSPALQRFPALGHGTTLGAIVGQVWLTGGDVTQDVDPTPILAVEGTADREGDVRPFSGTITISTNRQQTSGELAGANPICKQRIVSPIPSPLTIARGGGLVLRIDPRFLFVNVDFSELAKLPSGYAFSDEPTDLDPTSDRFYSQPSANLYLNLRATGGLYTFVWDSSL